MKHIFTTLFIFTLLTSLFTLESHAAPPPAPVPQTGQTLCYDSGGGAIPCANTGQDGEFQNGLQWPTPRFFDNGDQTQTDNLTGLIWSKDANPGAGLKNWQMALDYIKTLNSSNYLGHNDWRLPNINELASLSNKGLTNSEVWLEEQGFTSVQSYNYWSATTGAYGTDYAWYVTMNNGRVYDSWKINIHYFYVWPVRSGSFGPLILSKTGQTFCYDSGGGAIPCANTGQDGEFQNGLQWPTPRFFPTGIITDPPF